MLRAARFDSSSNDISQQFLISSLSNQLKKKQAQGHTYVKKNNAHVLEPFLVAKNKNLLL